MEILLILGLLAGILSASVNAYKQHQEHENELQREQELQKIIRDHLNSGKKKIAIKLCKDYYGCSLSKAKTIVSEIEFEIAYEKELHEDHCSHTSKIINHNQINELTRYNSISHVSAVDGMDGYKFEYFCADLLLKNGFEKADVTPGSGDQGVDIIAVKDGLKYAIQCKNYQNPLGNTPIQEVSAGKTFYGCHVAAVITNSTFTAGAQKLADATGVLLWDRSYIEKLIKKARTQIKSLEKMELKEEIDEEENKHYEKYIECTDTSKPQENSLSNDFNTQTCETIFYKGIMPSEKVLDFPVDCNTLTGSVNL